MPPERRSFSIRGSTRNRPDGNPWVATCGETRSLRGVVVPVRGEVLWKLANGDFPYYRWEVLDVETSP